MNLPIYGQIIFHKDIRGKDSFFQEVILGKLEILGQKNEVGGGDVAQW
jgi:hypothetical protein